MIKELQKYREDFRAVAFEALCLSRKYKILIVEGQQDLSAYRFALKEKKKIKVNSASLCDIKPGGKEMVRRLYETIKKLEPSNQSIAYLVDRDKDGVEKPPWFVTDYFCLENYALVWDSKNGNKFFISIDSKTMKEENGKELFKRFKISKNVRMNIIATKMSFCDYPVLSRILEYFKI